MMYLLFGSEVPLLRMREAGSERQGSPAACVGLHSVGTS